MNYIDVSPTAEKARDRRSHRHREPRIEGPRWDWWMGQLERRCKHRHGCLQFVTTRRLGYTQVVRLRMDLANIREHWAERYGSRGKKA